MRHYPRNSPESVSRIVALAMVADGRLDPAELDMLTRSNALERIGVSEERFLKVLKEFCADLLAHRKLPSGEECRLGHEDIARLLGELDTPERQQAVLRIVLDLIRADGRLHESESMLVLQALDQWRLRLADIAPLPARASHSPPRIPRGVARKQQRVQAAELLLSR